MSSDDRKSVLYVDQGVSFGGSLVVIASIVKSLDKNKYRAVVAGEMEESILKHHIQDNAKLYVIRHLFNYVHWEKTSKYIKSLRPVFLLKAGLYFLTLARFIFNTGYFLRFTYIMIKEDIDIVHINNSIDALAIAILLKKKCIWHLHGLQSDYIGVLDRFFYHKVEKIIAISGCVKDNAVEHGFDENKIVIIPNPVTPQLNNNDISTELKLRYKIKDTDKVIGIVGRLVEWKGQREFLKAVSMVLRDHANLKIFIVGDSADDAENYRNILVEIVEQNDMRDAVVFTGYTQDVASFYKIMDIMVHASITPEPFGLVITEAMSLGVPVIASSLGAPAEIIDNHIDGILVDPRNTLELANAITYLLENDEIRHEMGNKARIKVEKKYNSDTYARNIESIYQSFS